MMSAILQDVKYGIRMLVKQPGLSIIAVVALTLGIGLTATTFSIVYGALLRGLPFEESERLMHLERNNLAEGINSMEVTIHDFHAWREQQTSFEDLAAFDNGTVYISGEGGRAERYAGGFVTPAVLEQLRVQPIMGRGFTEEDDRVGAPGVILIGHGVWQNRFGGVEDIIGREVRANGEAATIVGVMPPGFKFPFQEDVWLPLKADPSRVERGEGRTLEVFGRLRSGVSRDDAMTEFLGITRRLALEYPETNEGIGPVIKPYTEEFIGQEAAGLLYTMLAAVFMVLLIACANVANLLLARAVVRSREIAVRTALGASRFRLISQMVSEAFAIAAVGGVLGMVLAGIGARWFSNAIVDTNPPFWIDIRVDTVALLFVLALVFVATLLSGILPAVQASGTGVTEVLKDESRGSGMRLGRFSRALVVFEIALSCGLLAAAGAAVKSVVQLRNVDYNFTVDDILTARIGLFENDYPDTESRRRYWDELLENLEASPGVQSAALATDLPADESWTTVMALEGEEYADDREMPRVRQAWITPSFFETFQVELTDGRAFLRSDRDGNLPVAIVNRPFVERFFPDRNPIGSRIRLSTDPDAAWTTIVGVVPDLWMGESENNERPEGVYLPLAQRDASFLSVALRSQGDPLSIAPVLRDEAASIDSDTPVYWVQSLREVIQLNTWFYRVFGTVFVVFGISALFLASVGLYGVMAFSVSRRTQEVGIRMALGADARQVVRLIMRQGMLQIGLGLLIGLGFAWWLSGALEIILYQVQAGDPVIFGGIVAVLAATGITASFFPARRATRVDPVEALRAE